MQWFHTVIEYALVTVLPFWATWRLFDLIIDGVKNWFSKPKRDSSELHLVEDEEKQYDVVCKVKRYKDLD